MIYVFLLEAFALTGLLWLVLGDYKRLRREIRLLRLMRRVNEED